MGKRARLAAEQILNTETYFSGYQNLFATARSLLDDRGLHAHSTL